ncbi:MAG: hypothetical protein MJZ17_08355 [Bacteroidales bacterium]|nr:hypothetical protein [Bacteroidales bacterium]
MAKTENYRRYGAGGPKQVVEPQWVKDLPKDDLEWTPEQDMAYYEWSSIYGRRGYSKKEWEAIHKERQRIKEKEFKELSYIDDYNGESILLVLKKKLEWQAEYFENFGHCESNPYKAARMRLCCRLIDIICWGGLTKEYQRSFRKYVNTRNAKRFENVPTWNMSYLHGEKQKLRYQKAYVLLFRTLYENILRWWD